MTTFCKSLTPSLLCSFQGKCYVLTNCFSNILLQLGNDGSGLIPKAIKGTAEDKHNNHDNVDKQHPPTPGKPVQLVSVNWAVCVSH